MQKAGRPPNKFELLSLCVEGVTAATSAKVLDRMFKRHGRWKLENKKDGYAKRISQPNVKAQPPKEITKSILLYKNLYNAINISLLLHYYPFTSSRYLVNEKLAMDALITYWKLYHLKSEALLVNLLLM